MQVFIGFTNGVLSAEGYEALSGICEYLGVSYDSAVRGKRAWTEGNKVIEIKEITVVTYKKRGKQL